VDFLALSAIFAASTVAGWLMFSFLTEIQAATQISDLLLSADVVIYMIMFVLGIGNILLAWILGGVSFGVDLGDVGGFLGTVGWGIVFAGVNGISAFPTLALSSSATTPSDPRMVISLVLLAPIGEELLWRGGGYGLINAYFPGDSFLAFIPKAFIPSLMFSIGHYWSIGLSAANFAFTFLSGYVLNFSYWYTKKLGTPMTAHFVWNLIQLHLQGIL
jgi:membrane protease YdiL (CAAX protease family)